MQVSEHPEAPNEFSGRDAAKYSHLLQSPSKKIIVNLHGDIENALSWVLTSVQLKTLLQDKGYRNLINSIITTRSIIFIGLSADDVAVGGLLNDLRVHGIDLGKHYWITHRNDSATARWADSVGIQVVRYSAADGKHAELNEIIDDLYSYLPQDAPARPISQRFEGALPELPGPEDLERQNAETIRSILNAHASVILAPNDETSAERYFKFCQDYDEAIHRACFISANPGKNSFFGFTVENQIGSGIFGYVYKARDSKDELVAIKLLDQGVSQNPDMLGSFRRGVNSMRILSKNKVRGMVPYRAAYELPACVIMDFVDGCNLQEAVESDQLHDWNDCLRIACNTIEIVRSGHMLPERVLHRDIRPPNIMLKNFFTDPSKCEVVILDFDLSWHKSTVDKTFEVKAKRALGYGAPEQMQPIEGVTSRSTLVDAFGFGMTLYYMFTRHHPEVGDYKREDWPRHVSDSIRAASGDSRTQLHCLTLRLARLIVNATRAKQAERCDPAQILLELQNLRACASNLRAIGSAEIWAEEILSRACNATYEWSQDTLSGTHFVHATGVHTTMAADELGGKVRIRLEWSSLDEVSRKNIGKYLPDRMREASAALRRGGWDVTVEEMSGRSVCLGGHARLSKLPDSLDDLVSGAAGAIGKLKFT